MKRLSVLIMIGFVVGLGACKKKDRLAANAFQFDIVPPSAQVIVGNSQTFRIQSNVATNPSWTVDSSTTASLNISVGNEVTLTSLALGDVILTAVFDGVATEARMAIESTFVPGVTGTFDVYIDNGLPIGTGISSDIQPETSATNMMLEEENGTAYTPEGAKFMRTRRLSFPGSNLRNWRITLDKDGAGLSTDLSSFSTKNLKFFIKLSRALVVGENVVVRIVRQGPVNSTTITLNNGTHSFDRNNTDWQEVTVAITDFGFSVAQLMTIIAPFDIQFNELATTEMIFDIDAIRWE